MFELDPRKGGVPYRLAGISGALTGAGAASTVFSFRWGSVLMNCLITRFNWWWFTSTAFTTAQIVDNALYVARGFSGSDSGGTDLTPATNDNKKKTASQTSLVTSIRISSTAALTAGTRTLDGKSMAAAGQYSNAVGVQLSPGAAYFNFDLNEEGPIFLAQNEGIVLQNLTAMGAAGVIKLYVDMAWLEIPLNIF